MPQVTLRINAADYSAEVEGRTLLVELLRDHLGLTGTHVGCDTSQCGACTVHIDGAPAKACSVLALDLEGAQITTIEGIAPDEGALSRVQAAFQAHHALQCGFCTPGMVMSATALLARSPKPDIAEIRTALEGNICRCTGYHNIIKAVLAASGQGDMVAEIEAQGMVR